MDWLELAKQLPLGHKTRTDCPACGAGTNTNAAVVNHNSKAYTLYCNACSYNPFEAKGKLSLKELKALKELNDAAERETLPLALPPDFTEEIPVEGRLWLYKAGITPTVWAKYGIGYSAKYKRVVLPVYDDQGNLIWLQCRAVHKGQSPKYIQPSRDRSAIMFTAGDREARKETITVEDMVSAIRVGEATRETGINATSMLGTKITTRQAAMLSRYPRVTTWLDGDRAGLKGSRNIRACIGLLTETRNIRTPLDPKEYSNQQIKEILSLI